MRMPSGVTDQVIYFVAVDATDLITRKTGLSSFTVYRSRNGGAPAAFTTPTVGEVSSSNMPGVYQLLLDEDMTIDSGDDSQEFCVHITAAGMAPVTRTFELYRRTYTAGSAIPTITGDAYARLGAPAGASVSADIAAVQADTNDIQTRLPAALVSGRMDSSVGVMAANTLTASAVATDAATEIQSGLATASALAAVAAYIDTEVASIKAVADRLDTAMEADGGVYRFTANALEQAPSGTGASAASIVEAMFSVDTGETAASAVPGSAVYEIVENAGGGSTPTATEIADAVLNRDMSAVSDTNSRSLLNAIRFLRNRWFMIGSTLTVTKENDSTPAWTAAVTTTPGAEPITGTDPG